MHENCCCVPGIACKQCTLRLADFTQSRLLCKDAHYDATQRVLRGWVVSFGRYRQKELCSLITGIRHLNGLVVFHTIKSHNGFDLKPIVSS